MIELSNKITSIRIYFTPHNDSKSISDNIEQFVKQFNAKEEVIQLGKYSDSAVEYIFRKNIKMISVYLDDGKPLEITNTIDNDDDDDSNN